MSYDLQIWSAEPVALPPESGEWLTDDRASRLPGRSWDITVWKSTPAESQDALDDIAAAIPGLAWFTELSLHPFDASSKAVSHLIKLARAMAKVAHGAVFDPQQDMIHYPPGVKRFARPAKEVPADAITMSWWLDTRVLPSPEGFHKFLELLEVYLPEALPRRYGTFEPPEFRYVDAGRPALERFLQDWDGPYILWYPEPPVVRVDLDLTKDWGATRQGFRCNHLAVAVDAAVLEQPGWELQLRRFWRAASLLLRPFYGDVRTLHGYRRSGRGFSFHPATTENHPVPGWFWAGLPPTLGHAVVVGEPYLQLWPTVETVAEHEGGLAFLTTPTWRSKEEVSSSLGGVPRKLADPLPRSLLITPGSAVRPLKRPYPKVWPFGAPFDKLRW